MNKKPVENKGNRKDKGSKARVADRFQWWEIVRELQEPQYKLRK